MKKVKTKRIVVLRKFNSIMTPGLVENRGYVLLKTYWRNEEGWYRVKDEETEKVHDVPDVFFG